MTTTTTNTAEITTKKPVRGIGRPLPLIGLDYFLEYDPNHTFRIRHSLIRGKDFLMLDYGRVLLHVSKLPTCPRRTIHERLSSFLRACDLRKNQLYDLPGKCLGVDAVIEWEPEYRSKGFGCEKHSGKYGGFSIYCWKLHLAVCKPMK